MQERLQKILARAGLASRRGAEELVRGGRVSVNGEFVRELGTKADASADDIRVDGRRVRPARAAVYLVLNKPRGVVTTRRDPGGRPTVMDLVPAVPGLFPVGRLDRDSSGLLIFTNDHRLGERLTSPAAHVPKTYHARVAGVPDAEALRALREGLPLDDGYLDPSRSREIARHAPGLELARDQS